MNDLQFASVKNLKWYFGKYVNYKKLKSCLRQIADFVFLAVYI